MNRLFISAAHKSSGKTTITLGLAAALAARGRRVQTFKKGPDYIDPMWLAEASGRPCYNLDFNTQDIHAIRATVAAQAHHADIALIEGNKGLHDGVDLEGADSSAALARGLEAPVVLVVDVSGITRGIAPLLLGYQAFDPAVRIAGVILNKVLGSRQETKLRQAVTRYTDLAVLGAIRRDDALMVRERHLGLTTPAETATADIRLRAIGARLARDVDLDAIERVAAAAPPWRADPVPPLPQPEVAGDLTIAVARDAAFGFYYADDLDAFARAGARLVFFDTLADARMPAADALWIGGGFPETQMAALAANAALRADIAARLRAGMPAYAECGGLMYLTRSIAWNGERFPMVGLIAADTVMQERPQGRGLVVVEETGDALWRQQGEPPRTIPAHEFHYGALTNVDPALRFAYRVRRGHGIDGSRDGIVIANVLASFTHLRDTAHTPWIDRFLRFVRSRKAAARSAATSLAWVVERR